MSPTSVRHNERDQRFELELAEGTALLEYERSGKRLVLVHTEVPPARQGQGIGSQLVEAALLHARRTGAKVIPVCPFVVGYIREHPEHQEIARDESA